MLCDFPPQASPHDSDTRALVDGVQDCLLFSCVARALPTCHSLSDLVMTGWSTTYFAGPSISESSVSSWRCCSSLSLPCSIELSAFPHLLTTYVDVSQLARVGHSRPILLGSIVRVASIPDLDSYLCDLPRSQRPTTSGPSRGQSELCLDDGYSIPCPPPSGR
ncbi:hypothetical protein C8Q80DRAFT_679498 [Daedaleopsis nitida]|nr:hypothetical protein C8Q80DRAFT_679498 [Daedaleopsis nitida]